MSRDGIPAEHDRDLAGEESHGRGSAALIRHVNELDAGARLQHFHGEVVLAAVADRRVCKRRVGAPRVFQEFLQALRRNRRADSEHHLGRYQRGDGHEVLQGIERQVRVKMRADDDLAVLAEEQRVPVGRGFCGELAREVSVRARAVLHDHRLAERLAEPGGEHPRDRVGRAAGGVGHEQTDRPVRVLRGNRRGPQRENQRRCGA